MISGWASTTFAALADRNYRILWIGTGLSFLAFTMSWVAQSVVAYDLTGKNGAVGVVSMGMGLSMLLISPFGGVFADRWSKRKMLVLGQAIIAVNFFAVGLLIWTDQISIPLLVLSTFFLGLVFSFIAPARQAWIGDLLKGPLLGNGIALQQVSMTATRIIGPFLAGALVAIPFSGAGGTYVVMGVLIAITGVTLLQMPRTEARPREGQASPLAEMRLGLAHVVERPRLALLAASFIGVVIAGYSYQVILPGLLENELGRDASDMAWLLGVAGIAGLLSTVAVAGLTGSKHAWTFLLGGGAALGAGLILIAFAPSFGAALPLMLLVGVGTGVFQLINNALVVQESDPAYYGRVMAVVMLAWGLNGLSGMPFGLLADAIGERMTMFIMGISVMAVVGLTWLALQAMNARGVVSNAIPAHERAAADTAATGS